MEEVKLELVCKGWAEKRARCSTGGKHWVCNEPLGGGGVHVWLYPGSGGQASCSIKIR